mmetsp:Transcript_37849/g.125435  ORF Transcript_37849/g.125435 Transcript_37849/m.125435 type:complete len:248 (+) Transcript_37849:160-903(+)
MLEHNIVTHWLVKVFSGTANSAWHGTVLVTFIFALSGSNAAAGVAEAAQNTVLADRWSAARTVCGGGAFVLVATATTSLAAVGGAAAVSESGRGRAYALLVVAMALWGVAASQPWPPSRRRAASCWSACTSRLTPRRLSPTRASLSPPLPRSPPSLPQLQPAPRPRAVRATRLPSGSRSRWLSSCCAAGWPTAPPPSRPLCSWTRWRLGSGLAGRASAATWSRFRGPPRPRQVECWPTGTATAPPSC